MWWMDHAHPTGRPRLRATRVEAEFRCTKQQKLDLRRLADIRNVSIGQLLDDFARQKYGVQA